MKHLEHIQGKIVFKSRRPESNNNIIKAPFLSSTVFPRVILLEGSLNTEKIHLEARFSGGWLTLVI